MKYTLVGVDGNAFSVMAYCTSAMKDAYRLNKSDEFNLDAQKAYTKRATSGDYNNLLCESMEIINLVNSEFGSDEEGFECAECGEIGNNPNYCEHCEYDR